jgi:predicted P-loop ATPase
MSDDIVPQPAPHGSATNGDGQADAQAGAQADADRQQRLVGWALEVLADLGFTQAIASAATLLALRGIVFDPDDPSVEMKIRDALHPTLGVRQEHFRGLKEGSLKRLLRARFNDQVKDREKELLHGRGSRQPDWTDELITDPMGAIIPCLANMIVILHKSPQWRGTLAYDEFASRVVMRKAAPWAPGKGKVTDTPWTDHYDTLTRVWFQGQWPMAEVSLGGNPGLKVAAGDVGRAVQAAARCNMFHPVREYFDALVWDKTPRLGTWLVTCFHADDTPYIRAIGPRWLISGVARSYDPGCKADYMPIFEGPQGKQKSEALRALAIRDPWFTDRLSHLQSKDAALETAGVLIIEVAELDALFRATSSAAKAYITRRDDRFRPPYGKHLISNLRQCIFAGTINPPVGGYFKDPTGARRFWPVLCHGMIDLDGLRKVRDQLWAEAVYRYKAGAPWWLETPQLEALAEAEQALRYITDPWAEIIRKWFVARRDASISEVLQQALGYSHKEWTKAAERRVGAILTSMGFAVHRPRKGNKDRERRYYCDPGK